MAILFLAANTSFADFPRLSSILARDGLMPRQFMNRGDKLAFSNGIIGLAVVAMIVVVIFGASVNRMIPLYAVGVFVSFTLSQSGMVVHWFRLKGGGLEAPGLHERVRRVAHGGGRGDAAGHQVPARRLPRADRRDRPRPRLHGISRHYAKVARFLEPQSRERLERLGRIAISRPQTTVVLFVSQVNELTARALSLGRALSPDDFHAVTITSDPGFCGELEHTWEEMEIDVPLKVVESPYREFTRPAVELRTVARPEPQHTVTVIIPEFVVEHWWENFLHNQNALRLKAALLGRALGGGHQHPLPHRRPDGR